MPFFSLDLLPLTHFRALKHPIPAVREHFSFSWSFLLAPVARQNVIAENADTSLPTYDISKNQADII
jgi:hypothetical protein